MTIPVSKVVNVGIQVSPTFPSQKGFGLLCIIGNTPNLPTGNRIRFYNTINDVAVDFGSTTEEYKAASIFFSQSPSPAQLAIARRFDVATPGELLGGLNPDKNMADYNAINNGALSLSVDGVVQNLAGLNLTACANLNAVAAAIQVGLRTLCPNAVCIYDGTRFIIRSGTTGVNSNVSLATNAPAGTDLAVMLAVNGATGAKSTKGFAPEAITDTLNNIQNVDGSWYGFTFTREVTVQNIKDAAAWCETQMKVFGYSTTDGTVLDPTSNADIAAFLQSMNYSRTIGQYDSDDVYAIVSALAMAFTVNFSGADSTINLKFKLEPGITPTSLTESQRLVLVSKNCNYYTWFGTTAMLAEGVMAGGRYFDEIQGLDWLQNQIELNVFGYLYGTGKVPQTDKGVARLVQQVESACQQAVTNGLLAPGVWTGAGLGQVDTGDFLAKGFYVYAAPVASQLASDRQARKAPPITVLAKGSGAINHVDITITFQR